MPENVSAGGAALSGAASGAAAGSAFGPWGAAIGGVVGGVGGYLSASGTASAQSAQNKAGAQAAATQNYQALSNYLASRGVNIQQLVAQYPEFQQEFARVQAAGDKRSFNDWFASAFANLAPNHPLLENIANPAGTAGAANTTLPAWAVGPDGKAIQPQLYQQLLGISTSQGEAAAVAQRAAIAQQWAQTRPDLRANWDADPGFADAYGTFENYVLADYEGNATPEQKTAIGTAAAQASGAAPGSAGVGNNTTLDPAIAALIPKSTQVANNIFDGTYLKDVQTALEPIAAARTAAALAQGNRTTELRDLSGNLLNTELAGIADVTGARTAGATGIYDAAIAGAGGIRDAGTAAAQDLYNTNVEKLAGVLGVRLDAAKQIYDASVASAGGVRDARTTGANDIYGAELLRADTYGQAAQDALSRLLAEQGAERARRGFTGGSSGSDITRARLMADYTQRGAGERANAGVNLQGRLSDAGIGYATDTGRARIGQATTVGQSREQDAIAQLNAAVERAKALGLVGTNYATTTGAAGVSRATSLAGAGEQNAIANLQAKADDARRRLGYLTSDADIAAANADLQNATDQLNAIMTNQQRQTAATSLPFQLAGLDLGTKSALTGQQYTDFDQLMQRLNQFNVGGSSGPGTTAFTPSSVLNGSQIAGGALTGLANNVSATDISKLIDYFKTTPTAAPATTGSAGTLTTPSTFLSGASVFKGPG